MFPSRCLPFALRKATLWGASTIARDITAQKRVEDQLRQAQKMEAVGRLAGGIAHDLNNILGIITACSGFLLAHIDSEAAPSEYIGHIRKAAKRGAALTRQLLTLQPPKSSTTGSAES